MDNFSGKTVIVTGASSGIGRAAAKAFVAAGANVLALARGKSRLESLVKECGNTVGQIQVMSGDATKEKDRKKLVTLAEKKFGGIDILVQAAGIIANGTIENTSETQWNEMMDINLTSVYRLMQAGHSLHHRAQREHSQRLKRDRDESLSQYPRILRQQGRSGSAYPLLGS